MNPLILISHFAMGIGMGMLRVRTGSLWPPMACHFAWNAMVLVEEVPA